MNRTTDSAKNGRKRNCTTETPECVAPQQGCEAARSTALGAAVALDRDPGSAEALARGAKAFASDAYLYAVKKGIQLHGGFGFTWDCDVHFYFKRAMWSRGTLGDGTFHRAHLARMLLGE
jgi:alkylation response protein AidB-like acyl-CoA dehydrogenase